MLRQRIITAAILAPLIIWSVLAFSHRALAIEFSLILALAAWEWAGISGLTGRTGRILYGGVMLLIMGLLTWLLHTAMHWLPWILYINLLWWLLCFILVSNFRLSSEQLPVRFGKAAIAMNLLAGILVLSGAFVALTAMHESPDFGAGYIIMLLIFIWIADIAAYFSGRRFGRHKLAPMVSPGKTWEGVAGAMLAVAIAAPLAAGFLHFSLLQGILFSLLVIVSVAFSILGDLTESLFKRRAGVKDSSQLLPGHGGILDRIDSLLAAAPVFMLGLIQAGIK